MKGPKTFPLLCPCSNRQRQVGVPQGAILRKESILVAEPSALKKQETENLGDDGLLVSELSLCAGFCFLVKLLHALNEFISVEFEASNARGFRGSVPQRPFDLISITSGVTETLVEQIRFHLQGELSALKKSIAAAHEGATHPESKPENKYDTRGLEASYLAGAQQARAAEIESLLQAAESMPRPRFAPEEAVRVGALVEVSDGGAGAWYFLTLVGGGYKLSLEGCQVVAISPKSPLGEALVGKCEGDSFVLRTPQGTRDYDVLRVE